MQIHLSRQDGVPTYLQIVNQVKHLVASGRLQAGEELPPIRVLAEQLVINPNTVARAYRELQGQGLLEAVRGTGLEVTAAAPARCGEERRAIVRQRLRSAIEEALRSELAPAEIEAILHEEWTRGNGTAKAAKRATQEQSGEDRP